MKKTFLILFLTLFFMAGTVSADVTTTKLTSAGLTPDSTFYFLDRLGENLREFFTFNPEAKAKLQIKFAEERISEISVMVEKKGTESKGIEKAKALLLGNVAQASEIIKKEKNEGKDISVLAKEIDDAFDEQEKLLIQTFQDARKKLKENRLALKKEVAGTIDPTIEEQIQSLDTEVDGLKDIQDDLENLFNDEQKKIEEELSDEDKEADEIEEAKEKEDEEIEEIEIKEEDEEAELEDDDEEAELEENNDNDENHNEEDSEDENKNNKKGEDKQNHQKENEDGDE